MQVPDVFNRILQSNPMQLASIAETSSKDVSLELEFYSEFLSKNNNFNHELFVFLCFQLEQGLTVICSKRGGNVFLHTHSNWLQTVPSKPEGILFKFVPITSLLTGIPGSGYLSHAINLYLRCKYCSSRLMQITSVWGLCLYEDDWKPSLVKYK